MTTTLMATLAEVRNASAVTYRRHSPRSGIYSQDWRCGAAGCGHSRQSHAADCAARQYAQELGVAVDGLDSVRSVARKLWAGRQ